MRFPPATDIRKMRKSMDITQMDLAHASGISQSTITKIEKGKISASYETVVKLFETLEQLREKNKQELTASDIASKNVISVQNSDKIHMATEVMRTTGYSQLPVLMGEIPVGSISEKSIFNLLKSGRTMEDIKDTVISTIMDESFPVVNESISLTTVTSMMSDCNAILVTKKGKVIGLITKADMLKLI